MKSLLSEEVATVGLRTQSTFWIIIALFFTSYHFKLSLAYLSTHCLATQHKTFD